jgi:predicted anti-sigma-YlaC factor YlaD
MVGFFEGKMHGSIRGRLEELLAGWGANGGQEQALRHLSACSECSSEFASMKSQSELLHTLRAPEELEPAPGFYARVLQRIEERAKDSIWAVFIYSPFGKRLAYASLMVAVMLGTYVITEETRDGHFGTQNTVVQTVHEHPLVIGSQDQQRDAVLANFAAHPVLANYRSQ